MPRGNGSLIGIDSAPNANVASGIWTVREAETLLRANKWPATPTVPGAPTGTAGNGQVSLTWTAPTGGSTVTDYIVQYSDDAGSTWTTFSDGVSTATSAIVTGLTNGTGYIFRIQAVNALGEGPVGSASGTITPIATDVALLLHFDGSNGSTAFTDSSPNGLTVTASGGAEVNTAESKFGGASLYLPGGSSGSLLSITGDLAFGTGDFTVEAWLWTVGTPSFPTVIEIGDHLSSSGIIFLTQVDDGAGSFSARVYSGGWVYGPQTEVNEWMHVAWVRNSGELKIYVNGTGGSAVTFTNDLTNTSAITIGNKSSASDAYAFEGYIDELRIVKGVAVYTSNFTPPTAPF